MLVFHFFTTGNGNLVVSFAYCGFVFAEEKTTNNAVVEKGGYASGIYYIYANNREIGTFRINETVLIRDDGKGMFLTQVKFMPKIADGLNDYRVISFNLDVAYGSRFNEELYNISWKDDSISPVITTSTSMTTVVNTDVVGYEISSSYSETSPRNSVRAMVDDSEEVLPGYGLILKHIYVTINNPKIDTFYTYSIVHFFNWDKNYDDFNLFYTKVYGMEIEGVLFAPNYEKNNEDNVMIAGSETTNRYFFDNLILTGDDVDDKYTNDYIDTKSFNYIEINREVK